MKEPEPMGKRRGKWEKYEVNKEREEKEDKEEWGGSKRRREEGGGKEGSFLL